MRRTLLAFLVLACGPAPAPPNWDGVEGAWVGELVTAADAGCETLPNPAVWTIDRANRLQVGLKFEGTQCGDVTADVLVTGEAALGYRACGPSLRVLTGRLERNEYRDQANARIAFEVTTSDGACEVTARGTLARAANPP